MSRERAVIRLAARCLIVPLLAGLGLAAVPGNAAEYDFSAATKLMTDNLDLLNIPLFRSSLGPPCWQPGSPEGFACEA